ncbi:MAG: succinyldiaminopimelate transaminase [Magnetococcales bacterium]|nr:succinyldiaminopimelate transaminase [Magnetococcales bacterium]
MNPRLKRLHPYPFEKLGKLLKGVEPRGEYGPIDIAIGEPRHPVAPFIREALTQALDGLAHYPSTRGGLPLRQGVAAWIERRYQLPEGHLDVERHLLPVNGTREALFSITQAVVGREGNEAPPPVVLMPNPFYQIYEGAAHMAGAEPVLVEATAENHFLPDYESLPEELLGRTRIAYLCTPSNPTGSVYSLEQLQRLIALAERHDFILASDECYSEIWDEQPPPGILEAAYGLGRVDFSRCLAFNSLSKRSNMPGARSGFVAGDAGVLADYFRLRTYTGCATPPFIQQAAVAAWADESHVEQNRALYREKLATALEILSPVLPVMRPDAGFYLWLKVPGGGEAFARQLFEQYRVRVLPGGYLGRPAVKGCPGCAPGENPGDPFIRVALVATLDENRQAMERIARLAREMSG